jgi:hypothetical protein
MWGRHRYLLDVEANNYSATAMWEASYVAFTLSGCLWRGGHWLEEREAVVFMSGALCFTHCHGCISWAGLQLSCVVPYNSRYGVLEYHGDTVFQSYPGAHWRRILVSTRIHTEVAGYRANNGWMVTRKDGAWHQVVD